MQTSSLVAVAVSAAVAAHGPYAEWLSPHVGKEFFVSENLTVATEKARATAGPWGAIAFTSAGVGTDFGWFENKTDRVSLPLASLRVALRK